MLEFDANLHMAFLQTRDCAFATAVVYTRLQTFELVKQNLQAVAVSIIAQLRSHGVQQRRV